MSSIKVAKQDCSLVTEIGKANCLSVMKKFTEATKPQCKTIQNIMPRMERATKKFITGSNYEGTWDLLGISGYGVYTYPNGVTYEGDFNDGQFHGEGELRYESGAVLRGSFVKGEMTKRNLTFADGLEYTESDWKYCREPDRRFTIEYDYDIQPAGASLLTAEQPSVELHPNTYDTGDGSFDPKTLVVYKYDDPNYIIRAPSALEQHWTELNCRTSKPLSHEPRPDLYETWCEPEPQLPVPPPPAAITTARDISIFDFDQRDMSGSGTESLVFDNEEPAWRRSRRSTAAVGGVPKIKKAMFYKAQPEIIPRETESDDEDEKIGQETS